MRVSNKDVRRVEKAKTRRREMKVSNKEVSRVEKVKARGKR